MTDELKEMSFPLQRSPAMKFLGNLLTGNISGQVLVGALLFIGVLFMGRQNFNYLSIGFFAFILFMSFILHKRMVSKGKKLMDTWCDIRIEENTIHYKSGFPNTMDPEWQEVTITKDNNVFSLKGSDVGGYHIRIPGEVPTRLGLWIDKQEALTAANKLADLVKAEVIDHTSISKKKDQ